MQKMFIVHASFLKSSKDTIFTGNVTVLGLSHNKFKNKPPLYCSVRVKMDLMVGQLPYNSTQCICLKFKQYQTVTAFAQLSESHLKTRPGCCLVKGTETVSV